MADDLPALHPLSMSGGKIIPEGSPYMTLQQASDYLKVSPSWLERSDCPRLLLGRLRRYHRPTLDQWALARLSHHVGHGSER